MSAQYPRADRVERAQPQPIDCMPDKRLNAVFHFPRCFIRESHSKNLMGRALTRQKKMREACRQNAGFTCPRASEDQ